MPKNKPLTLVILDGWGIAPPNRGNAISMAKTPVMDKLVSTYPAMTLQASGEVVGLPWGEMGNSEVGHLNLGGGKIIYQNLPRITHSIADGKFFNNKIFLEAINWVKKNHSQMHLMGLVSNGGVHSSIDHLYALLEVCQKEGLKNIYLHCFLDGRDTPPNSALNFIDKLESHIKEVGIGEIATLVGRYYAMDRDNRWDRVEKAYLAIAEGKSEKSYESPQEAIKISYQNQVFDEEFIPTVMTKNGKPKTKVKNKDAIIYFNFRPDRARELTKAFILPGFEKFKRPKFYKNLFFVTMTEYEKDLPVKVAFPPEKITMPLARVISDHGLKQFHIAETEKYAHVTFFFNGGREEPFPGEDRVLVPSPSVSSYDQKPEMSAREVKEKLVKAILSQKYAFLLVNFANLDMVGHTGNIPAVIKAAEMVDQCLGEVVEATLSVKGIAVVTADHGNAEELINLQTGEMIKEHSQNPVPFIVVGEEWKDKAMTRTTTALNSDLSNILPTGVISDVPVTALFLMGLEKPKEMTGRNLLG